MGNNAMVRSMKAVSYVVLAALAGSFAYTIYIALTQWTGIGV